MAVDYVVQLVVHAPNGGRLGILPDVISCSPTTPMNEIGSLTFSYPKGGRNVELISQGFFEIGLEIDHGAGFVEPDGCRYINIGRSDEGTEVSGAITFDMPSYGWLLKRARINPYTPGSLNEDGKKPFANANAGHIMGQIIDDCKARGVLPLMLRYFSATHGTNGVAFDKSTTVQYDPGQDLYSILQALAADGLCDWTTRGRELVIVRADSASEDRSNSIVLRYGRDLSEGPNRVDATNLTHMVVIQGDGTALTWLPQAATTPQPWGVFEDYITVGGATDLGTLVTAGDATLASGVAPATQYTRTIRLEYTDFAPHFDFHVGDWITAPDLAGNTIKLRVREIAVVKDSSGVSASMILNDRLTEASVLAARRASAISHSSSTTGSGSAPGDDNRVPGGITNLAAGVDYFINDAGDDQGVVTLSWTGVSTDVLGVPLGVSGYEIWRRRNIAYPMDQIGMTQSTSIVHSPYPVNNTWQFTVRAISDAKVEGHFSDWITVPIVADNVPPPVPSTPTVTARLGVLCITWDGLGVGAVPQPRDYRETLVYVGLTSGFVPGPPTLVDGMYGAGMVPVTDLPYNVTRFVKLVSVDRRGNRSAPSAVVAGYVTPLVDTDFIGEIIAGANLIDFSVDGTQKISAGSIDTTRLRVGQANLIVDPNFLDADITAQRMSSLGAGALQQGVTIVPAVAGVSGYVEFAAPTATRTLYLAPTQAVKTPADVVEGTTYTFGADYQAVDPGGLTTTYLRIYYRTPAGSLLSGATKTIAAAAIDDYYTIDWLAPPGAVVAGVGFISLASTGTVRLSNASFRPKIPGVLIENGAVTAAKIAALTITAGNMAANSITADKITAGSITGIKIAADAIDGKTITGATIRTAATGARLQMDSAGMILYNSVGKNLAELSALGWHFYGNGNGARVELDLNGLRLYNSGGVKTVDANAATGDFTMTGVFNSELPGVYPQIVLDTHAWTWGVPVKAAIHFKPVAGMYTWPAVYCGLPGGDTSGMYAQSGQPNSGSWRSGLALTEDRASITHQGNQLNLSQKNPGYGIWMVSQTGVHIDSVGDVFINADAAGGNNKIVLQSDTALYQFPSSSAPPNLAIGSGNILTNATSLRKYKLNRTPVEMHYSILDMSPVTWTDAGEFERDAEETRRYAGFVAEDLEDFSHDHDDIFKELLRYDDDLVLGGVQYERITAFLIPVIRDMANRITTLEATNG